MATVLLLSDSLDFAYRQFGVYDTCEPYCPQWEPVHSDQGFLRRPSHVGFVTLADFGSAPLRVFLGSFEDGAAYDIAIAVPFLVVNGQVAIEGPEEVLIVNRKVLLPPGPYRMVASQKIMQPGDQYAEDEIAVDLYFEPVTEPLERSAVLVSHPLLHPPPVLEETAKEAFPGAI